MAPPGASHCAVRCLDDQPRKSLEREASMLMAPIFGTKLLGERDAAARILGAGLIALGVAALAMG